MGSTSRIAESGLQVAALTLDVSANNVANVLSEGFEPSRVEPEEVQGGGVRAAVVKEHDPLAEVRADRALLLPNSVDLVQEMVNQNRAAAVYRANMASLTTEQELERELVQALEK
jgi:flagellar basal body rod protein FlgC